MAALHMEEPDLFRDMHVYTDQRAGAWPEVVVQGLAAVAEKCIGYHSRTRSTVRDVLPDLVALGKQASSDTSTASK